MASFCEISGYHDLYENDTSGSHSEYEDDISGSHGNKYEDGCLLGCCPV
jgi:hypothetical protein